MQPVTSPRRPALPPSVAIAWGLAEPSTRGPKPGLTVDAIVETAIGIADADGLAAVSMSKVAAELGYTTMSLYRYVSSKDDLVALMFDAAAGAPQLAEDGWRDGLASWATALREVYRRHGWMVDVPISAPPAMPGQLAWLDRGLAVLEGTPLAMGDRLGVILLLSGYTRFDAELSRDLTRGVEQEGVTMEESLQGYQGLLDTLVTADRFPALHGAIQSGLLSDGSATDGEEFEFGLQRILDGIEVHIGRQRRSRR